MRGPVLVAWVFGVLLTAEGTLHAGVYSTVEPKGKDRVSTDFRIFRSNTLIPLRQIADITSPQYKQFILLARLGAGHIPETLSAEERLNLSTCLLRLQDYSAALTAVGALNPLQRSQPDNLLVYSNLIAAEQLAAELSGAKDHVRRLLDVFGEARTAWPKEWSKLKEPRRQWLTKLGWSEKDYVWYRQAEEYHWKLLRLRIKETKGKLGQAKYDLDSLDALFDPTLQFVGESGQFEAGKLSAAQRLKLPSDSLEMVQQLLVWMPLDMRLYWLLGELYNSRGDWEAARDIFEEIATKIKAASADQGKLKFEDDVPKGLMGSHLKILRAHAKKQGALPYEPPPPPPPPVVDRAWVLNPWQTLGVGFAGGVLAAFFGYWQFRELRRRRQPRVGVPALAGPTPAKAGTPTPAKAGTPTLEVHQEGGNGA